MAPILPHSPGAVARHCSFTIAAVKRAAVARLVEEFGICETLKMARPDDVEFRDVAIEGNEGNFDDGLWVQEVINAVEISHHERRWVSLPLGGLT